MPWHATRARACGALHVAQPRWRGHQRTGLQPTVHGASYAGDYIASALMWHESLLEDDEEVVTSSIPAAGSRLSFNGMSRMLKGIALSRK